MAEDVAEISLKADAKSIDAATRSLDKLDAQSMKTEKSTDRLNRETRESSKAFTAMAGGLGKLVGGLAAVVTTGAAIRGTVTTIRDFTAAMSQVEAISRATGSELEVMTATARKLGAETSFSATQAAQGMQFLSMAGFTAKESVEAIPRVLDLAKASALDLGTAADIASNVMSGFGIAASNAGDAVDILAAISARANTNVFQLGEAVSYVGPVAAAMGISLGDASAAMGVLSDAGIQGASAGTGLRRVLSSLANPAKDARDALGAMGLSLDEVNPATNSLTDIIDRLAMKGIDAADALTIFGDRGGPAILALTRNNDRVRELSVEMENVSGEAKRMADIMNDNLQGDTLELVSAMQELALALGDAGVTAALRGTVQGATLLTRTIGFLLDEVRAFFGVIDNDDFVRLGDRMVELQGIIENARNPQAVRRAKKELKEVEAAYDKLLKKINGTEQSAEKMFEEAKRRVNAARESIDEGVVALANWKREADAADAETQEFADTIRDIMDEVNNFDRGLSNNFAEMEKALEMGLITSKEWMDFLDHAFPEVVVEAQKLESGLKDIDEANSVLVTSFERGIERMRDGIGDFFQDFIEDGKASFDDVTNLFKSMIAEMIATAAANRIFVGLGLTTAAGGASAQAVNALGGGGITDVASGGFPGLSLLNSFGSMASGAYAQVGNAAYSMFGANSGIGNAAMGQAGIYGQGGMTAGLYGVANVGAGLLGNWAGQQVFGGNTTGIGSTAGGVIGSIWGPIGTAIGSFLGEGLETALGNVLGFGGQSHNRVSTTAENGVFGDAVKHGSGRHKEQSEAINSILPVLRDFSTAIGGTTFSGKISASAKNGFELNGDQFRSKDAEQFLEVVFKEMIMGAEQLSDAVRELLLASDEGAEGLALMAQSLAAVDMMLEQNPVAAALKDIQTAQDEASLGMMGHYDRLLNAVTVAGSEFDGTAASAQTLAQALGASQAAAYQMVVAIQQLRDMSANMFQDSVRSIRESMMTEEELFSSRREERNQLQRDLRTLTDVDQIQQTLTRINELNNTLFNSIKDPTQAQADSFIQFAETTQAIADKRLEGLIGKINETQQNQMDRIQSILESNAARQEAAVDRFAEVIDDLGAYIARMTDSPSDNVTV